MRRDTEVTAGGRDDVQAGASVDRLDLIALISTWKRINWVGRINYEQIWRART